MTIQQKASMALLVGCCLVMTQLAAAQELLRPDASTVIKPVNPSAANTIKPQAADGTRGMALMGAYLNANGTMASGSGVTSTQRFAPGGYIVLFDRDVATGCTYATAIVGLSQAVIRIIFLSGNQLQFNTNLASTGVLTDTPFSVIVFCPR
jgi:hypothetical protein